MANGGCLRAGLDLTSDATVECERLSRCGQSKRDHQHADNGGGVGRKIEQVRRREDRQHHDMADDVHRHQRELDPVVGSGNAVLHLQQRVERQCRAGDHQRQHDVAREQWLGQLDGERAADSDGDRGADRQPAAAVDEAAQQRTGLGVGIFGSETLRRRSETEVGEFADHKHPGPDIDVDAELESAHPAGEQDLRAEHQRRADNADQKRGAGDLLRNGIVARIVAPGADTRDEPSDRSLRRPSRCFRVNQRHHTLRTAAAPGNGPDA